jgi:hypothetical protein
MFGSFCALIYGMKASDKFRNNAALLLLVSLLGKVENPARTAVFWADQLIKELNEDTRYNNSN